MFLYLINVCFINTTFRRWDVNILHFLLVQGAFTRLHYNYCLFHIVGCFFAVKELERKGKRFTIYVNTSVMCLVEKAVKFLFILHIYILCLFIFWQNHWTSKVVRIKRNPFFIAYRAAFSFYCLIFRFKDIFLNYSSLHDSYHYCSISRLSKPSLASNFSQSHDMQLTTAILLSRFYITFLWTALDWDVREWFSFLSL